MTVEGLSGHQRPGWNQKAEWHPLQRAFIETGAIQSGYDTPALILAGKALLDRTPRPTEAEVRDAISGIVSRETGYIKPVQAILRAAAYLRGEDPGPVEGGSASGSLGDELFRPPEGLFTLPDTPEPPEFGSGGGTDTQTRVEVQTARRCHDRTGEVRRRRQGAAQGGRAQARAGPAGLRRRFRATRDALWQNPPQPARPRAHQGHRHPPGRGAARRARGADVQERRRASSIRRRGSRYPIPGPLDYVSFDDKVRYVGDRVAAVAAETPEIAAQAVELIKVTYEVLPPVLSLDAAMAEGAPVIHDQSDYVNFGDSDPSKNLVAKVKIDIGDVDAACEGADHVFETEVETQKMKHVPLEPWVTLTYWDEDDRLVIMTSTQVPFHVRRILAPVLGSHGGADSRDQAAHRRGLRQQTGNLRGHPRAPDHRHGPPGAAGADARGAVHLHRHPPPDARALSAWA